MDVALPVEFAVSIPIICSASDFESCGNGLKLVGKSSKVFRKVRY